MPWRPLSHSQRLAPMSKRDANQAYNRDRRLRYGPDPRSTARWRRVRLLVLGSHPLCADPYGWHRDAGRVVLATEVDHIRGIHEAPELVFTLDNLQGLCTLCHGRKSADERQDARASEMRGGV